MEVQPEILHRYAGAFKSRCVFEANKRNLIRKVPQSCLELKQIERGDSAEIKIESSEARTGSCVSWHQG